LNHFICSRNYSFRDGEKMLEENLDFDGVDEICGIIEDLTNLDKTLLELNIPLTFSISAPLN
jgi:hypothetical protein